MPLMVSRNLCLKIRVSHFVSYSSNHSIRFYFFTFTHMTLKIWRKSIWPILVRWDLIDPVYVQSGENVQYLYVKTSQNVCIIWRFSPNWVLRLDWNLLHSVRHSLWMETNMWINLLVCDQFDKETCLYFNYFKLILQCCLR